MHPPWAGAEQLRMLRTQAEGAQRQGKENLGLGAEGDGGHTGGVLWCQPAPPTPTPSAAATPTLTGSPTWASLQCPQAGPVWSPGAGGRPDVASVLSVHTVWDNGPGPPHDYA